jgi:hypothetical protein
MQHPRLFLVRHDREPDDLVAEHRPAVLEPGRATLLLALNAGDPSFEANPTS